MQVGDVGTPSGSRGRSRRVLGLWLLLVLAVALALALFAGSSWRRGRTLVVAFADPPVTLDPHLHNHNVTWSVVSSFYDGLVELGADLTPAPALASSWQRTSPVEWRFDLREQVRFHDGQALSAADVVASFERVRHHPRSPLAYLLAGVRSVRAVGESIVVIETEHPIPDLLNRVSFVLVVPQSLTAEEEIAQPVGTGPYRMVARQPDATIEARSFAGWRPEPAIREVLLRFYDTYEQAAASVISGDAHLSHLVPEDLVTELRSLPGIRIEAQPRLAVQLLALYPDSAGSARRALLEPAVRRALLLALDRPGWVRRLLQGDGTVASQYVHPVVFGYDPAIQPLPYAPAEARWILVENGFADGFSVTLGHTRSQGALAEAIATELGNVGVRVERIQADAGRLAELGLEGKLAMQLFTWGCGTGDAMDFFNRFVWAPGGGRALVRDWGVSTDDVDGLLAQATEAPDAAARLALLQHAQRQLLEVMPMLPLTVRWGYAAMVTDLEAPRRFDERESIATFHWRR